MEIGFDTPKLARLASSAQLMRGRWGEAGGRHVGARLLQMRAAPTLAELARLPGRCRALVDRTPLTLAVDVAGHTVITFRPVDELQAVGARESLVWGRIHRVSITDFEDF